MQFEDAAGKAGNASWKDARSIPTRPAPGPETLEQKYGEKLVNGDQLKVPLLRFELKLNRYRVRGSIN
jgi:hypothetical protein